MENSQLNKENPPRSPTIWGMAVATMVLSMAAKVMANINATKTQFLRMHFHNILRPAFANGNLNETMVLTAI